MTGGAAKFIAGAGGCLDLSRTRVLPAGLHGGECRAGPVLREVHRERGCASVSSWQSLQDEIYPVQGT